MVREGRAFNQGNRTERCVWGQIPGTDKAVYTQDECKGNILGLLDTHSKNTKLKLRQGIPGEGEVDSRQES